MLMPSKRQQLECGKDSDGAYSGQELVRKRGETMPTPRELYQAGQLQAAIQALTAEVRANPADGPKRIFLFELLSFAGEWARAQKQIDAPATGRPDAPRAVQVSRANIRAERAGNRLSPGAPHPHSQKEP